MVPLASDTCVHCCVVTEEKVRSILTGSPDIVMPGFVRVSKLADKVNILVPRLGDHVFVACKSVPLGAAFQTGPKHPHAAHRVDFVAF